MWNLIVGLKTLRENSVQFFLLAIWSLDVLKRIIKIFPKRLLNKEIEKAGLKFNPGLGLIGLWTTGPRSVSSKAEIIHAPGYGVGYSWGEKQFEQFSPSHLVIGLILWTPNHTLVQAICRTNLQQQTCTWTHKSPC